MLMPFHRLLYCSWPTTKRKDVLLAASGPTILAFNVADGSLISKWSHATPLNANDFSKEIGVECTDGFGASQSPDKKRKLSNDSEVSEAPSTEIVVENSNGKSKRPKTVPVLIPSVACMCGTSDNRYFVVITGEDKAVHVLEMLDDGSLRQLSRRVMPKRPSCVALSPDQKTILCGDKFGDVHGLPLLLPLGGLQHTQVKSKIDEGPERKEENLSSPDVSKAVAIPFVPAANSLTVHSKRNQRALKNQQELANQKVEKKTIEFEHELLLGHVSLLTDLLCATIRKGSSIRHYILTSDRDEHIRVSRGIPQAYIIEGYCLGHTQFVSKMCIPPWKPELLVSGGGDDYISIWDWQRGTALKEVNIRTTVDATRKSKSRSVAPSSMSAESSGTFGSIAISGIWASRINENDGHIIIACEALPALLIYYMDPEGMLEQHEILYLDGNVLDVAFSQDHESMFCSTDNVHKALTTDILEPEDGRPFLDSFHISYETSEWVPDIDNEGTAAINRLSAEEKDPFASDGISKLLSNLFYGIEHLRKRKETIEESE